jgi:hypothetical protein
MGKTIILGSAVVLILLTALLSCSMPGMSDVEFAKGLMKESSDSSGLYTPPGKSAGPAGLTIVPVSYIEDPAGVHNYELTLVFDHYVPDFAPNSDVSGDLTVNVVYDENNETVTIVVSDTLTVAGEHKGVYRFNNTTLTIDLVTGEYEYSGTVTIVDTVHDVSK